MLLMYIGVLFKSRIPTQKMTTPKDIYDIIKGGIQNTAFVHVAKPTFNPPIDPATNSPKVPAIDPKTGSPIPFKKPKAPAIIKGSRDRSGFSLNSEQVTLCLELH